MSAVNVNFEVVQNLGTDVLLGYPYLSQLTQEERRSMGSPLFLGSALVNAHLNHRFHPPTPTTRPEELFQPSMNRSTYSAPRFIHKDDPDCFLIYTDGACLDNGKPTARAGYAVVFRPIEAPAEDKNVKGRLEREPGTAQTSNRAELRAAVAALKMRSWNGEGFGKIVLAMDSEYVVLGICEYVTKWRAKGWKKADGKPVQNKDLWERLVQAVEMYEGRGVSVRFWLIPRAWNAETDRLAKAAAALEEVADEYEEVKVVMC